MRTSEETTVLDKNLKCQIEPYSQTIVETIYRQKEKDRLQNCNSQLLKCFKLRQDVEDHEFGYLFKLPVDPYALQLADYWHKIRRPIDLKSIKHKFFLNLYKNAQNFNEDMTLMFGNSLYYNQNNPEVFSKIKNISTHYHHEYQKMTRTISQEQQKIPAVQRQLTKTEKKLLQKDSLQKDLYSTLFSRKQIGQLANCLNKFSYQKKKMLMKTFTQRNKELNVDNQYVALQNFSGKQLFDLLNLAICYKKDDFQKGVQKDQHSSEGLSERRRSQDQDEQSSFEIQDQI